MSNEDRISKLSQKDRQSWLEKPKANCDPIEQATKDLCYPKMDVEQHPSLKRLLEYREKKGDATTKCFPNSKDPCALSPDNLVIPNAQIQTKYHELEVKWIVNQQLTISCSDVYQDLKNYTSGSFGGGTYSGSKMSVTVEGSDTPPVDPDSPTESEKYTYIKYYLKTEETEENLKKWRGELNRLAITQALSELDCSVSSTDTEICPDITPTVENSATSIYYSTQVEPLDITDRLPQDDLQLYDITNFSNKFLKGIWGTDATSYDQSWQDAGRSAIVSAVTNAYSGLSCTYYNEKQEAYCIKPLFTINNKLYSTFAMGSATTTSDKIRGISLDDLAVSNYDIIFPEDGSLYPIKKSDGSEYTIYEFDVASVEFIDPSGFEDDITSLVTKGNSQVYSFNNKNYNLVLGNHQGFNDRWKDQPFDLNNPPYTAAGAIKSIATIKDENIYDHQNTIWFTNSWSKSLISIDSDTAVTDANKIAFNIVAAGLVCAYKNYKVVKYCPTGYEISQGVNTSAVNEWIYQSLDSLLAAQTIAATTAEAGLSGCILYSPRVKAFCDKKTAENEAEKDGISKLDLHLYVYQERTATSVIVNTLGDKFTANTTIYIYRNNFNQFSAGYDSECFSDSKTETDPDTCTAFESVSIAKYTVDKGTFTTTNPNEGLGQLLGRALELAKSYIMCQYGNRFIKPVDCATTTTLYNGVVVNKVCSILNKRSLLKYHNNTEGSDTQTARAYDLNGEQEDIEFYEALEENCLSTGTEAACITNEPSASIPANSQFSDSPSKANEIAINVSLAQRVCVPCTMQSPRVKAFCDKKTAENEAEKDGIETVDLEKYVYAENITAQEIADVLGDTLTSITTIYTYRNNFTSESPAYNNECWNEEATDTDPSTCLAFDNASVSKYIVEKGTFTLSNDSNENIVDLLSRALALGTSSILCQYGNRYIEPVTCDKSKTLYGGHNVQAVCTGLLQSGQACTGVGSQAKCAVSEPSFEVQANTYFSTEPFKANEIAVTVSIAQRVCIPCDKVGGGGGGTSVSISATTTGNCSNCKSCVVFVD